MRKKKTPLEKEWEKLEKQEQKYLAKKMEKTESRLNQLLEEKVPNKLQGTLDKAFYKAFYYVFEKGTGIIEKTYNKEEIQNSYKINAFTADLKGNRKSLKAFSKKASGAGNRNLLLSGLSGVGMGILGIGIPDIVVFTSLMLKNIYEIALHYGFDYEEENEKKFCLLLIQGALSYGEELNVINEEINQYIERSVISKAFDVQNAVDIREAAAIVDSEGFFQANVSLDDCIKKAAGCLSKELLYMKFLQGIPVVGAAGGAYDVVYMNKVATYAKLKYQRRFLMGRK